MHLLRNNPNGYYTLYIINYILFLFLISLQFIRVIGIFDVRLATNKIVPVPIEVQFLDLAVVLHLHANGEVGECEYYHIQD